MEFLQFSNKDAKSAIDYIGEYLFIEINSSNKKKAIIFLLNKISIDKINNHEVIILDLFIEHNDLKEEWKLIFYSDKDYCKVKTINDYVIVCYDLILMKKIEKFLEKVYTYFI